MKKILVVGLVFMFAIIFFNPTKELVLNAIYPHYSDLIEKGYQLEEIKQFSAECDEEELQVILSLEYAPDALRLLKNADYKALRDKDYSEIESDRILAYPKEIMLKIMAYPKLSEYFDLFEHEYFIADRFDRYLAYAQAHPDQENEDILRMVNVNRDYPLYTHIKLADVRSATKLLVNKYYQLPQDYVPQLKESYGGFMMEETAADALLEMCAEMKRLNLDFALSNTYRSFALQERIYNRYLESQSQAVVDTFSARPGHSEHQAGLAVDFRTKAEDITDFDGSEASVWLKENAHMYGFIQRYTQDNSIYTGYKEEAWHYRYVGTELAQIVYDTHLSLEEVLLLY